MAQAGVVLDKNQFNCSICLDVLRNPVTIPCGHSYCSDCIQNYWDQDDYLGVFTCPQCRQSFNPRPPLARNTMLDDVVERFKLTGLQQDAAPPPAKECPAQADDVECDVCTGRKNRAVNSCLVCLASYCELHVRPHHDSAVFRKHKLVPACKRLQETICPKHNKLLEVYCRTDKQCICCLCLTDEHKGHDSVLAEAEIQQQQRQLCDTKQNSQLRIQQKEKEAQELRQAIMSLTRSARAAVEKSDSVFAELIHSIQLRQFEVRELISAQEKMAISQAEQLLERIEREIAEQKTMQAELQKLAQIEDYVHFLQSCQSLHIPPMLSALPPLASDPSLTFGPMTTALLEFKGLLEEVCQKRFVNIYERVRDVVIVSPPNAGVQQHDDLSVQMDSVTPPPGPSQSPVNPPDHLLTFGPPMARFALPPYGPNASTGPKPRHFQRRTHARRK